MAEESYKIGVKDILLSLETYFECFPGDKEPTNKELKFELQESIFPFSDKTPRHLCNTEGFIKQNSSKISFLVNRDFIFDDRLFQKIVDAESISTIVVAEMKAKSLEIIKAEIRRLLYLLSTIDQNQDAPDSLAEKESPNELDFKELSYENNRATQSVYVTYKKKRIAEFSAKRQIAKFIQLFIHKKIDHLSVNEIYFAIRTPKADHKGTDGMRNYLEEINIRSENILDKSFLLSITPFNGGTEMRLVVKRRPKSKKSVS